MEVTTVPIEAIDLDPANVRTHDKRNIKAIKDSLTQFGQRKPIVVMRGGGDRFTVIAGNGTLEAARELEWSDIAVAVAPEDWTSDEAAAFAIADNRTAELAAWDEAGLKLQLEELESAGFDISLLGFDAVEDGNELVDVVEDEAPEPAEDAVTKRGDVWLLGDHRLMCGDSTDQADFSRLMCDTSADCVFTDPPYNVSYVGGTKDKLTIENDSMSEEQFAEFLNASYSRMFENTREGGPIYVCHADSSGHTFREQMLAAGWLLKQCLVWVKQQFVLGRQDYNWQHEPILYGWKPGAAHSWHGAFNKSTVLDDDFDPSALKKNELVELLNQMREHSTVVREDRPSRNEEHPTMKPVKLVARLVANSTTRGDIVLDPFGGSGSTLIACEQLNRSCYSMELDPIYCDVIVKRWETFTGQTAELLTT